MANNLFDTFPRVLGCIKFLKANFTFKTVNNNINDKKQLFWKVCESCVRAKPVNTSRTPSVLVGSAI